MPPLPLQSIITNTISSPELQQLPLSCRYDEHQPVQMKSPVLRGTVSSSSCPSSTTPEPPSSNNEHVSKLQIQTTQFTPIVLDQVNNLDSSALSPNLTRRQRGEKRPIPEEQKDEKYYERRKRNNEAAKKSRDARKLREDRVS